MKTIGIVAEYNPFHNGHLYQLHEVRRRLHADYIIAAMSGDFVQRGEPAVFDKFTRTRMALFAGAEPCGRALDFLCQEFHREINTLGNKANDAAVSAVVVRFKAELEAFREQVQNIE